MPSLLLPVYSNVDRWTKRARNDDVRTRNDKDVHTYVPQISQRFLSETVHRTVILVLGLDLSLRAFSKCLDLRVQSLAVLITRTHKWPYRERAQDNIDKKLKKDRSHILSDLSSLSLAFVTAFKMVIICQYLKILMAKVIESTATLTKKDNQVKGVKVKRHLVPQLTQPYYLHCFKCRGYHRSPADSLLPGIAKPVVSRSRPRALPGKRPLSANAHNWGFLSPSAEADSDRKPQLWRIQHHRKQFLIRYHTNMYLFTAEFHFYDCYISQVSSVYTFN
jgi:hypothetical protein